MLVAMLFSRIHAKRGIVWQDKTWYFAKIQDPALRAPYGFDFVLRTSLRMTRGKDRGMIGHGGGGYGMRHSEWRQVSAAIEPRRGGTSQTWRNLGSDVSAPLCLEDVLSFPSVCEGMMLVAMLFSRIHAKRGIVCYG